MTRTLIGYQYIVSNGDGSYSTKKFKTKESADAYAAAEEALPYYEGCCDAGPDPVYLEDYEDQEHSGS